MSAGRKAGSDGSIIAWNSPGTQIDHNTLLLNGNEFYAVEFRFATTTNCTARNNLADAPIHLRDSANATQSGNLLTATAGMLANPSVADLHLLTSATNAIDKAPALASVTNDFDGEVRPRGGNADVGADEFKALTPPTITDFQFAGTNAVISFSTIPGQPYEVQRATNVVGGQWTVLASNITGTGGVIRVTNLNVIGRQFYRVKLFN